ncbi:MAG TPA: polysaccharide biosynthesis C-terminal domain-containing protein, partial [Candidatus Kapabacteria bacterium]|nr:polysaccharide biosynthesis C-terminal domain-containing protein [Candidatus Kapabacteria bacterium]
TACIDLFKLFPALHLYKREVGRSLLRSLDLRFSRYKNIARITLPFALVNIMSILQSRVDVLFLEHFRSTAEVGIYTAGERFINALTILPGAMFNGLIPLFSLSRGTSFSKKFSMQSVLFFSLLGIVISGALYLAAPLIISLTFRFPESVIVLQILAWSFAFFMFNTFTESWLYGHHYEKFVVYARIVGIIAIVGTNIYFAPLYGATGTAIATIVSECILSVVFGGMLLVKRRRSATRHPNKS